MIVTADWVLPVSGPALRHGAVLVDEAGRVAAVAPLADLVALSPAEPVEGFDGCVIIPGLVNAHTHLSLTVLGGLVEPMPMRPFLARVTTAIEALTDSDLEASAALGALECLRNGVTCVGDIAYGPEPQAACAGLGLAGVFYVEVLGTTEDGLDALLAQRGFPRERGACAHGRVRCGLSPHTPYTAGPGTLLASAAIARASGASLAVHLAESPAERELMLHGTGPLSGVAHRLAHGFEAPGAGSVAYLERLGILGEVLAVHCANLEPGDPERLAAAKGVALCPRSNAYLANGEPPAAALREAGVRLALGTDSAASNWDLDLLSEARALRKLDPALCPVRLLEMVTVDGARVLGMDDVVGSLTPGLDADLAVLRVGDTDEPEAAVIAAGGRGRIVAVMAQGRWRVRDGRTVGDTSAIEIAAASAHAAAATAISASA
jgi:cytosine/adenosine deaminase-related metal-dependent hydrolase